MMTRNKVKVTSPDALAEQAGKRSAENADTPNFSLALFPSADQLVKLAASGTLTASDHANSGAGDLAASLDVPPDLLNPLQSLPLPLSIDDVKKQVQALPTTYTPKAD
jgi:hypothetical protein